MDIRDLRFMPRIMEWDVLRFTIYGNLLILGMGPGADLYSGLGGWPGQLLI